MKKAQIFLFHFAGGSRYSYQFLTPFLQQSFEVISLELPGRGGRIAESLLVNSDAAIDDLLVQVKDRLSMVPFCIYGHSLGATLAFEVVAKLQDEGKFPSCLIVSGNSRVKSEKKRGSYGDDELIDCLADLGGVPDQLIRTPDFLDFFMPIIRADFKLSDSFNLDGIRDVNAPILAAMGRDEENVDAIDNWRKFTCSEFKSIIFDGGHFFIYDNPVMLAKEIIRFHTLCQK